MRFTRGLPFLSVAASLAAAISAWLALTRHMRALTWATLFFGLLAGVLAVMALRQRSLDNQTARKPTNWRRVAVFVLAALFLLVTVACLWQARNSALAMVHPSRHLPTRTPEDSGITDYQTVEFTASDGLKLRGWYMPTQNGAVVILVHGHASARSQLLLDASLLVKKGYGALVYDTRNCGESDGEITTFGLLEVNDVRGALAFVQAQPGVDPQRIGVLGHSLGGATAIMATARLPQIRALIAESTYTSLEDNVRSNLRNLVGLPPFPFAPLVIFWGEWETGVTISQVRPVDDIASISPRPVLIIHGEQDKLMPVANAYRLYEAAWEPKELYIIPNAGHGLPTNSDEYVQKVTGFFDRYLLQR